MMKKIVVLLLVILVAGASWFYLYLTKLDYSKIIFVLPSSERASSPFYYRRDGDFFLADDLKKGFEKKGYQVAYRFRENYDNLELGNAGNIIYFKGYYNFKHLPAADKDDGRKRILYLYYIEGLNPEILKEVDAVACASQKLIDETIASTGVMVQYVPQFTNPERFRPYKQDKNTASEVLFVGSNHTRKGRISVKYAIQSGAEVSVFGKFWQEEIAPQYLKGAYINNDELYKYYANAKIVLNDHREDMKYFGFVSNRIYDVTASGGFVFTDYLPEIEAIYGGSIATYKDFNEFDEKLKFYLSHPDEREKMAAQAREITLHNFTNDVAAEKFIDILKNIQK